MTVRYPTFDPNPATTRRTRERANAYLILGVSPNDVLLAPKITPLLKRLRGGISAALDYLRASPDPDARKFIAFYDDPTISAVTRRVLPLEAFCLASKVDMSALLGAITRVAHMQGAMLGAVIAATEHPEIVRASAEYAKSPLGEADRMAQLKHMGFLPSPKGAQIQVFATANAQAGSASLNAPPTAAPPPEDTIRRIVEARQQRQLATQGQRELPATDANESVPAILPSDAHDPVYVEGEYEDADGGGN